MNMHHLQFSQVFKLSTGEKVSSLEIEKLIKNTCHYVKFVSLSDAGRENHIALIFPDKKLLDNPEYKLSPDEGCFCPRNLDELGRCLTGCLKIVNTKLDPASEKINASIIINTDLSSIDTNPSSENMSKIIREAIQNINTGFESKEEEIYYIQAL
ncbi:MAG: hypothetical protein Q8M15_00685 [Bacteroidota bacterium]|nr:hypothetical protein [Bacteroidota bacterium]